MLLHGRWELGQQCLATRSWLQNRRSRSPRRQLTPACAQQRQEGAPRHASLATAAAVAATCLQLTLAPWSTAK